MIDERTRQQLADLGRVTALLERDGVDHWLFGGWAVDLYVGAVSRPHGDVDLAVWLRDAPTIAALLAADGWRHAPDVDEDGGTGYERGLVRLELTFLVRDDAGRIGIVLHHGFVEWDGGAFGDEVRELGGARCRVIALEALVAGKAATRGDAADAAKDRADLEALARVPGVHPRVLPERDSRASPSDPAGPRSP